MNDINILDHSSIVGALRTGEFNNKVAPYSINGGKRDWMYFLVDGIYPSWLIFVKTFSNPVSQAKIKFSKQQEHVQKDIERCFGVVVKKFGILKCHLWGWYASKIKVLVDCCVILHNMTQELQLENYLFHNEMEWEENNNEDEEVQTIFLREHEFEGGGGGGS